MTSIPTVEDYGKLTAEIDELKVMVRTISLAIGTPQVLKISDIADIEGVSRSQICGKEAYLLPNFGKSDYPDGTKRWKVETYLDWRKIPIDNRKRMFRTYLNEQKEKSLTSR